MSFEPVDVFVKTDVGVPVPDVLVHVYNPDGTVFFTNGQTDADGKASFLLETLSYSMRFNRFQTGFSQPQLFDVLAAPATNVFDVVAEPFVLPIATDPRLCRCSGFFRDLDGSPKRWLDIHFISRFDPLVLDEAAVVSGERHLRTNEDGYGQIDLIRGGIYLARIQDQPGIEPRCVYVPDAASTNLPDLLFPIVESVSFDLVAPFTFGVGDANQIDVVPTVLDSSGRPLEGSAVDDVLWKVEDETIATVFVSSNKLTLRGNQAGSTRLLAERKNASIIKIPATPIVGQPVDITVTP